jgi:hypothetical protein
MVVLRILLFYMECFFLVVEIVRDNSMVWSKGIASNPTHLYGRSLNWYKNGWD